ncbi:MAG: hypothetical protein AB8I08_16670 [Sandaracinaceae bacterium]
MIEATELPLSEVERRSGWVRVRRDFRRGSTLDGWVRESDVEQITEHDFDTVGESYEWGGLGLCSSGSSHTYRGPATLLAGSEVRDASDGAVWARVEQDLPLTSVRVRWGSGWAQLVRVDGIHDHEDCTADLDRAWVPVTALRFPNSARGVPSSQVEPAPEETTPPE